MSASDGKVVWLRDLCVSVNDLTRHLNGRQNRLDSARRFQYLLRRYLGKSLLCGGIVMQFNFFQWVREGVKQSVLLGVSDAVDEIGTLQHSDELNQQLRSALGSGADSAASTRALDAPAPKRRRASSRAA